VRVDQSFRHSDYIPSVGLLLLLHDPVSCDVQELGWKVSWLPSSQYLLAGIFWSAGFLTSRKSVSRGMRCNARQGLLLTRI